MYIIYTYMCVFAFFVQCSGRPVNCPVKSYVVMCVLSELKTDFHHGEHSSLFCNWIFQIKSYLSAIVLSTKDAGPKI